MQQSRGFTLVELLLGMLLASVVVLSVMALFLPLSGVMRHQRAWSELAQTGRLASCVLVHAVHKADALMASGEDNLALRLPNQVLRIHVGWPGRRYQNGHKICGLYLQEDDHPSVEWVSAVETMQLRFFQCALGGQCCWAESGTVRDWSWVRAVEFSLQLTAEGGLHQPWRFCVALPKNKTVPKTTG